jgi:two-component system response regulator AlgR
VLIVDDEQPARERLRRMLGQIADVSVAAEAANGSEALDLCARLDPDVVLLDVRMPGMDGIETARHLAALEDPPAIIFTTAYDEHAVDAFETQAAGYLLKPVRQEKLERAMRHAARVAGAQLARIADQSQLGRRRRQIGARLGDQLRLIPVDAVYYFMAGQKYVTVRHRGGSDLIDEPLRTLEAEFAPEFLRVHRNALVAARCVSALERGADGNFFVRLRDCEETLPVSRRHVASTLRRLRSGTG